MQDIISQLPRIKWGAQIDVAHQESLILETIFDLLININLGFKQISPKVNNL
jgi:hypothetical protein